ncbi:MAG: hypothetical protein IPM63_13460 [Acidobacteriota bacterium]|nr:MAG: hypothetical protein IPM63_13460 [Acidobacteriota bacterium]
MAPNGARCHFGDLAATDIWLLTEPQKIGLASRSTLIESYLFLDIWRQLDRAFGGRGDGLIVACGLEGY